MLNINADFLKAGRAVFTAVNPTGTRYTYRISQPKEDCPFFIGLLTGPDNTHNFTYLGIYNPKNGEVTLTRKSQFFYNSLPVKVLQWAIRVVHEGRTLPEGYAIQHEGRCGRCGRPLTVPESLDTGLGPDCAEQLGIPWQRKTRKSDIPVTEPY